MILPKPNEAFEWTSGTAPALVCGPVAPFAAHVFTSRGWRLGAAPAGKAADGWEEVARAIDVASSQLLRVHQVHGARVVAHWPGHPFPPSPEADIVATSDPRSAVAIQIADCVPLLIVDTRTHVVAAAHAGWRGLAARVPGVAVAALEREFGSRASKLMAVVGPAIGPCCYQVGVDVRERFASAGFGEWELNRWFAPHARSLPDNPSLATGEPDDREHWFLDMWTTARDQLRLAGVREDRIYVAEMCTASHPDIFCSYRRDGSAAGRMAAVMRAVEGT